jgi:hypothetical protein
MEEKGESVVSEGLDWRGEMVEEIISADGSASDGVRTLLEKILLEDLTECQLGQSELNQIAAELLAANATDLDEGRSDES